MTPFLSEKMINAGQRLIKKLDNSNLDSLASFWLKDEEEKYWRLIIVSPLVDKEGARNYYKRINDLNKLARSDEEIISLHDITVSNTHNRYLKEIQRVADFTGNKLYSDIGFYKDNMYVYPISASLLNNDYTQVALTT